VPIIAKVPTIVEPEFEKVEEVVEEAKDKIEDTAEEAKDKVEDTAEEAKDQIEDAAAEVKEEAKEALEALVEPAAAPSVVYVCNRNQSSLADLSAIDPRSRPSSTTRRQRSRAVSCPNSYAWVVHRRRSFHW
jgi:vacuolar-type H+-ATPase subunit H